MPDRGPRYGCSQHGCKRQNILRHSDFFLQCAATHPARPARCLISDYDLLGNVLCATFSKTS